MDFYSLRSRYAVISVLLGVVVMLTAVSANYLLSNTRDEAASNIDNRNTLLNRSRGIRNAVWEAREAIGHFLIDPQPLENREHVHNIIGAAIDRTEHLLQSRPSLTPQQRVQVQHITEQLQQLDAAATQLMNIRLDTNLQYQSMVLARDELLPRQQLVFDALATALDETLSLIHI